MKIHGALGTQEEVIIIKPLTKPQNLEPDGDALSLYELLHNTLPYSTFKELCNLFEDFRRYDSNYEGLIRKP